MKGAGGVLPVRAGFGFRGLAVRALAFGCAVFRGIAFRGPGSDPRAGAAGSAFGRPGRLGQRLVDLGAQPREGFAVVHDGLDVDAQAVEGGDPHALVHRAGEVRRRHRHHVLEAQLLEEAPDVVDAVLGVDLPAFGNVLQHEVPGGGDRLVHRDHRTVRVYDLDAAQALAVDACDETVQPVDGRVPVGHRALDEPRLGGVAGADVQLAAGGIGLRGPAVAEHPVGKLRARSVFEHEAHRLRILALRVLQPELRVKLRAARLRLDPPHPRRAEDQAVHLVRIRRVALLLLDDPGLAVPRHGERPLAPRHPDPRHGVHPVEQRREDGLAAARDRIRFAAGEEHRADHRRGDAGEGEYRAGAAHRP